MRKPLSLASHTALCGLYLARRRAVLRLSKQVLSRKGGRWSDAATWSDKKVPAEGALVTINQGMDVVLDVSTPPLHGFDDQRQLSLRNNKDLN